MILPRRLYQTAEREFCEEDDVRQAYAFGSAGMTIADADAEKLGLKAYLDRTGYGATAVPPTPAEPEQKAVDKADVEDKALAAPTEMKAEDEPAKEETPPPGVHMQPESRRMGSSGRRG
jgi:hypothetical protein